MEASPWPAGAYYAAALKGNPPPSDQDQTLQLHPLFIYKGEPAVLYPESEVDVLSAPFSKSLIGKFGRGRPTMDFLRKQIQTIGFKSHANLSAMDNRHIRITFDLEEDYHRCWLKRSWSLGGRIMRVLKWTKSFDYDGESALVPVWLTVEFPPMYFFHPEALKDIGRSIGELLFSDAPTKNLTMPSTIRLCVEMDVSKPKPSKIRLGSIAHNKSYNIFYEDFPDFCKKCCKLGHSEPICEVDEIMAAKQMPSFSKPIGKTSTVAPTTWKKSLQPVEVENVGNKILTQIGNAMNFASKVNQVTKYNHTDTEGPLLPQEQEQEQEREGLQTISYIEKDDIITSPKENDEHGRYPGKTDGPSSSGLSTHDKFLSPLYKCVSANKLQQVFSKQNALPAEKAPQTEGDSFVQAKASTQAPTSSTEAQVPERQSVVCHTENSEGKFPGRKETIAFHQ